jgi:L-ascorbate metabolism protein UlaG (beta-lactamase superfamily)
VDLSGHTPGHSGILVETPEATIFHLGDAFLQLYELKTHKAPESLAVKFHHAFFENGLADNSDEFHGIEGHRTAD